MIFRDWKLSHAESLKDIIFKNTLQKEFDISEIYHTEQSDFLKCSRLHLILYLLYTYWVRCRYDLHLFLISFYRCISTIKLGIAGCVWENFKQFGILLFIYNSLLYSTLA